MLLIYNLLITVIIAMLLLSQGNIRATELF